MHTVDYHDFTDIDTPLETRRKSKIGDIWINAVECVGCGDTMRSMNQYDLAWCGCGAIAVYGGSWYKRRVGNIDNFTDKSVLFNDLEESQ